MAVDLGGPEPPDPPRREQPPARRRFTVEEYYRMAEAGIFTEDDRVELLDGEIFELSPIGPAHAGVVNRLNRLFVQALGDRAVVTVQNPVRLSRRTEPQPDLTLARPRPDYYTSAHPGPDEVLLTVEVAVTSHAYDRDKLRHFAAADVPEVWIVDAPGQRIEVYRSPHLGGYAEVLVREPGEVVACTGFPDVPFAVAELLGAA